MTRYSTREIASFVSVYGVAVGSLLVGYSNHLNQGSAWYSVIPMVVGSTLIVAQTIWLHTGEHANDC